MSLINGKRHGPEWEHVYGFILQTGLDAATGASTEVAVQGHHVHAATGAALPPELIRYMATPRPGERSLAKLRASNPTGGARSGTLAVWAAWQRAGEVDDPVPPEPVPV